MDSLASYLTDLAVYHEILAALAILLVFVFFAYLTRKLFQFYSRRVSVLTQTTLDDEILNAIRRPLCILILVVGVYTSLSSINAVEPYLAGMVQALRIALIIVLSYAIVNVLNGLLRWYMREIAVKTQSTFDDKYMPAFKKVSAIAVYLIAGILILGELGIEITPLIASLGVGGLAVALALQETLANFFAGAYIVADKPLKPGDYIEFDQHKGYVEEIGWRSTRIKTLPGNFIVVPNAKLAQSTITNYYGPQMEMSVVFPLGVSYDSDLEKVEKVTVEVAKKVLQETPGGVKDFEPFIRYNEFDDFSINFSVILRVEKFVDKYLVIHEFMKALKKRYDQEGITIPFPIRTLYMKEKQSK